MEREALQKADEFLARLSAEAAERLAAEAAAMQLNDTAGATASGSSQPAAQKPAKKQKTGKRRIPVLGQLVEPAAAKPKQKQKAASEAPPAAAPTCAPTAAPTPAPTQPVVGETKSKPVAGQPQYSDEVQALFRGRDNRLVNTVWRPTALDLWERDDAERAEAERAAEASQGEEICTGEEMDTSA